MLSNIETARIVQVPDGRGIWKNLITTSDGLVSPEEALTLDVWFLAGKALEISKQPKVGNPQARHNYDWSTLSHVPRQQNCEVPECQFKVNGVSDPIGLLDLNPDGESWI